jgi:hypothetical protein
VFSVGTSGHGRVAQQTTDDATPEKLAGLQGGGLLRTPPALAAQPVSTTSNPRSVYGLRMRGLGLGVDCVLHVRCGLRAVAQQLPVCDVRETGWIAGAGFAQQHAL